MSLYKKRDNSGAIKTLNIELHEWDQWQNLLNCPQGCGKFLIEFLNTAMEKTLLQSDLDADFKTVRSQFKALKTLRDTIINAAKEVNWRQEEIKKLS